MVDEAGLTMISEHNLSFNIMNHFSDLLPKFALTLELQLMLDVNVPKQRKTLSWRIGKQLEGSTFLSNNR